MHIIRNFWFYFNFFPILVGIFSFFKIKSFPSKGNFNDALDYCKNIDNEIMLSEGTKQDYCIDNFMNGNFNDLVPWILLFLLGIAFIIPFSLFLIKNLRIYRYDNYNR